MAEKIYLKQMLHTPDNNPIEVTERIPGVFRPCVKDPDMEELVGSIDDEPVTSPTAEEASVLGLLRGLLAALQAQAGDTNLGDLATLLTALGQKDFATQTTLAAILAKLSADPATQTTLAAVLATLQGTLNVNVNGSLVAKETNKAVTANTNILAADYTADGNKSSLLMVLTDTSSVLSLLVDGVSGTLNSGIALDAGKWYAFEIPITYQSTYNLQSSVSATMQIKWVVM